MIRIGCRDMKSILLPKFAINLYNKLSRSLSRYAIWLVHNNSYFTFNLQPSIFITIDNRYRVNFTRAKDSVSEKALGSRLQSSHIIKLCILKNVRLDDAPSQVTHLSHLSSQIPTAFQNNVKIYVRLWCCPYQHLHNKKLKHGIPIFRCFSVLQG